MVRCCISRRWECYHPCSLHNGCSYKLGCVTVAIHVTVEEHVAAGTKSVSYTDAHGSHVKKRISDAVVYIAGGLRVRLRHDVNLSWWVVRGLC